MCYGLTPRDAAVRLAAALRTLGVAAVFDLSVSREVALLETAAEFVRRYRLSQRGATELASVGYGGAAAGSGATRSSSGDGDGGGLGSGEAAGPLPMLASACPGWVCYAEKTHGTFVLPHISSTKSPQVTECWGGRCSVDQDRKEQALCQSDATNLLWPLAGCRGNASQARPLGAGVSWWRCLQRRIAGSE